VLSFVIYRSRSTGGSFASQTAAVSPASQPAAPTKVLPIAPKKESAGGAPPAMSAVTAVIVTKNANVANGEPVKPNLPVPAKTIPPTAFPPNASLRYVPGSSTKLEQLIGDQDKGLHKPTLSQTGTRYQIQGTDLGNSFEHEGHAYFLFGDTMGQLGRWLDPIATTDATDPERGVKLGFLTVSGAPYLTIQPPSIRMGMFEVPVGGISLDGQMYVVVSTNHSADWTTDRSVLTKFLPPVTFQPLHTISQLPAGRFIRMSMHAEPGPIPGLPPGGPYVLLWGTGTYRQSDAYLSIVPVAQFETGKGTRYFAGLNAAGAPSWSENESDATPIVQNGTLGDLSVTWCKDLGLWLMTYDRRKPINNIAFSYSRTPWGPWSEPQVLFGMYRDGAIGKFIHDTRPGPDDGLAGPVLGPAYQANPGSLAGVAYAPYVVERWTKVQGSELNLYYVLSTWNPYVAVLMKSRLQIE
jgi:uncharacterized protein DUF4185